MNKRISFMTFLFEQIQRYYFAPSCSFPAFTNYGPGFIWDKNIDFYFF